MAASTRDTKQSIQSKAKKPEINDLHMHLNGSFSMEFLEKTAAKNNCTDKFEELKKTRTVYKSLLGQDEKLQDKTKSIALIWKQFGLIHQIVKTLDDIQAGTIDVVSSSSADYLEIRTTPKDVDGSWIKYADAFQNGLSLSRTQLAGKKVAVGLLSLDRTIHDAKIAHQIIDHVTTEKAKSGLLVGIDISGNPLAPRTLTGQPLKDTILYALSKNIGLAIHIGEADTQIEKAEVDVVLSALSEWAAQQKKDEHIFRGKVRLGHGIFLTEQQKKLIKDLHLPIEICPSCHNQLDWWKKETPHPVTSMYSLWKGAPVVVGTDDEIIFGADAKQETLQLLEILGGTQVELDECLEQQVGYRF